MTDTDPRCAKCGHKRSEHNYRHPFVGPSRDATIADLSAKPMVNLIDTTPEAVALLPRPDGESTWTLDPEFVAKVSHAIQREDGWETTMEVVQLAMLAAEKHILELFPIPALAARIAELEAEHEEKDERIEDLQHACEVVSGEFEGELWQACRYLLGKTHFDFSEANVDGIQAADFQDHMNETLAEFDRAMARIEELEAQVRSVQSHLAKAMEVVQMIASADVDAVLGQAVDISCEILGELMEDEGDE